ncbi:MAG: coproporphyrinogen-III oxidase family protein, partial [Desulfovibrionaceae bacterium]|nr:coproporphyrinogen-III oxidase family protein [Desulfovibrionaceae bacterium]
ELAMLGRLHNADQVCRACEAMHAADISSLNLDLMWGLPGQTEKSWESTLTKALRQAPDHISAYSLTLEEGTPLCSLVEQKRLSLPDENLQEDIYLGGRALLEEAGFVQYEISNYAKPGHECRHNLGYWHQKPYLGVGPSAVSTIGNKRFTAPADHAVWKKAVCEGRLPCFSETLSHAERIQELLMLRLRTAKGLPFSCYEEICARSFQKDFAVLLRGLEEAGYMQADAGHAALTGKGMLVSNDIMARFFAILDELDIPAGTDSPDRPDNNSAK